MGEFSVLYTALEGIETVIWTDVLQEIALIFAAFLAIVLATISWTMMLTKRLYKDTLRFSVGVSGVVITGIFAAVMSTLDSSLNAVATTITNDFFMHLGARKSDQATAISTLATFVFGYVASILNRVSDNEITPFEKCTRES
eukprot:gene1053-4285_t